MVCSSCIAPSPSIRIVTKISSLRVAVSSRGHRTGAVGATPSAATQRREAEHEHGPHTSHRGGARAAGGGAAGRPAGARETVHCCVVHTQCTSGARTLLADKTDRSSPPCRMQLTLTTTSTGKAGYTTYQVSVDFGRDALDVCAFSRVNCSDSLTPLVVSQQHP